MNPFDIRSAQFLDTYFPMVDGVVQTVNHYATLMNRESYACVVTPKGLNSYDDSTLPYDVYRTAAIKIKLAEYSLPAPKLDRKLGRFLDDKTLDIVHAHSPFSEGSYAAYYAKSRQIPSVATFHSKYYDDALHVTHSKMIARGMADMCVRFYNKVDSVWACSEGTADTLRSYGFKGDIFVMDNGSSLKMPENAEELKKRAAGEYGVPDNKRILLFVGHQIWHKNLKLILDTFRLICDRSDQYRLFIVGNGYDAEKIKKYAESLNFPERFVRFTDKIMDRGLLTGMYLNADLLFFPSVYDNSPLVVREAASLGTPSLLTEGSNAAEAVKKDISGFTAKENAVSMYKEIVRIFSTEGLLEKVSKTAQEEVARPWEKIIPLVREKYADIIERYRFEHKL